MESIFMIIAVLSFIGCLLLLNMSKKHLKKAKEVCNNVVTELNIEKSIRYEIAIEAIRWAYADCCVTLNEGKDPRQVDMADVIKKGKEIFKI